MMKFYSFMVTVATAAFALFSTSCSKDTDFFKVENSHFTRNGKTPYYFIGANFWYGSILASEFPISGNRERLLSELDSLKELGVGNLRILVGVDAGEEISGRGEPALQKAPGVYDERLFEGLDYLLAEMGKRDMKAVMFFNNSWEWSGGYGIYLEWAGHGTAPMPAKTGYIPYTEKVSKFITDDKAKKFFDNHLKKVISRTNSVTGVPYTEDPTIFSWQICNEPRCFSDEDSVRTEFVNWLWKTASLIKSLDPNHMVSTGSEGKVGCENDIHMFERIHACPDIDYLTIHIWPYNWGWINKETIENGLPYAISMTDKYISEHLALAKKFGKPVVIEEFGYPRDGFQFSKDLPTASKDKYYKYILGKVVESHNSQGLLAGANFWAWGGQARQKSLWWKMGDDYCGDPPQEQQGLYSVYASDSSTIEVIRKAAMSVNK